MKIRMYTFQKLFLLTLLLVYPICIPWEDFIHLEVVFRTFFLHQIPEFNEYNDDHLNITTIPFINGNKSEKIIPNHKNILMVVINWIFGNIPQNDEKKIIPEVFYRKITYIRLQVRRVPYWVNCDDFSTKLFFE